VANPVKWVNHPPPLVSNRQDRESPTLIFFANPPLLREPTGHSYRGIRETETRTAPIDKTRSHRPSSSSRTHPLTLIFFASPAATLIRESETWSSLLHPSGIPCRFSVFSCTWLDWFVTWFVDFVWFHIISSELLIIRCSLTIWLTKDAGLNHWRIMIFDRLVCLDLVHENSLVPFFGKYNCEKSTSIIVLGFVVKSKSWETLSYSNCDAIWTFILLQICSSWRGLLSILLLSIWSDN
jgi:hypothetical protein